MTEEQFWRSNPRIIKVYEQTWKDDQNRKNELLHAMVGTYGISAITVALSSVRLTMTCMELIDTEQVTVVSGDRSITINTNNLLMTGYSSQNPLEEIE